ncbi:helix-turn-helix domain-containing protein [Jeotgalibacillus sp. ET6]|uniref:helix-turn-helix domain-containing protein n=1 Tax=Jeotgalibacillus sp. ET6 TaxID=3037260 RepID=UPI002418379A|nr:helix-turn-helix domain-containing protein [Jeotgalibacillus sp. ET6]MDG5470675.1 helix-turn-helix domain-containing protein [Jeotgalibacillus sp. ET6]
MTYLDAILLVCFRLFNGDRSRSAIFHLVSGKKTSQTIQDGHLYGAQDFFQIFPDITRETFDLSCARLAHSNYLLQLDEQRWNVSKEGENALKDYFNSHHFPNHLKGWLYHDRAAVFWKRLLLLTQSLSNYAYRENRFYPVQRDPEVQHWVKSVFLKWGNDRNNYTNRLFLELTDLCSEEKFPDHPDFIIQQMTGYQLIGMTANQLAGYFSIDIWEVHIRFLNSLHFIFNEIQNQNKYPILYSMQEDLTQKEFVLTVSSEKTLIYINQAYSVEQIARIRNLKKSTIEDHIIEITLMIHSFSIDRYVHHSMQEEIWQAAAQLNNKRIKEIKEMVPDASFFQIRLVLVSKGRMESKWKIPYLNTLGSGLSEMVKKK